MSRQRKYTVQLVNTDNTRATKWSTDHWEVALAAADLYQDKGFDVEIVRDMSSVAVAQQLLAESYFISAFASCCDPDMTDAFEGLCLSVVTTGACLLQEGPLVVLPQHLVLDVAQIAAALQTPCPQCQTSNGVHASDCSYVLLLEQIKKQTRRLLRSR